MPQEGETCNCNPPRTDCQTAVKELSKLRWSLLNRDYIACVVDGWVAQGCYNEIAKNLGYRFTMLNAKIPSSAKSGSSIKIELALKNDGYASPFNTHTVEVILRSKTSGKITKFKIDQDVRKWWPELNPIKVALNIPLPSNLAADEYDVLLNIADPEERLYSNPAFSIRFANLNTWEVNTGFNTLLASIKVAP